MIWSDTIFKRSKMQETKLRTDYFFPNGLISSDISKGMVESDSAITLRRFERSDSRITVKFNCYSHDNVITVSLQYLLHCCYSAIPRTILTFTFWYFFLSNVYDRYHGTVTRGQCQRRVLPKRPPNSVRFMMRPRTLFTADYAYRPTNLRGAIFWSICW